MTQGFRRRRAWVPRCGTVLAALLGLTVGPHLVGCKFGDTSKQSRSRTRSTSGGNQGPERNVPVKRLEGSYRIDWQGKRELIYQVHMNFILDVDKGQKSALFSSTLFDDSGLAQAGETKDGKPFRITPDSEVRLALKSDTPASAGPSDGGGSGASETPEATESSARSGSTLRLSGDDTAAGKTLTFSGTNESGTLTVQLLLDDVGEWRVKSVSYFGLSAKIQRSAVVTSW